MKELKFIKTIPPIWLPDGLSIEERFWHINYYYPEFLGDYWKQTLLYQEFINNN